MKLFLSGIILGLSDGLFNPCALSVLFFLIAYLFGLGSKKKVLISGIIFSISIFIMYYLFMCGILTLVSLLPFLGLIRNVIGILVILGGIIETKDFFFYGKWVSFQIPKSAKPMIESLIKKATVPSILLLGIFVSLVEIPCAGSFPLVYTAMLASNSIGKTMKTFYLLLYNFFFVLPLISLTLIFYLGWVKVEKAEEKRKELRKWMRLISGVIMISLGILLLGGMI